MKLERVLLAGLAVLVLGQAAVSCIERRARRKERIAGANALADASRTERRLVGQLQVATRYIHQGQIQLDRALHGRDEQGKVALAVTLEGDTARGRARAQPVFGGAGLHFRTSWGNPDSIGVRVTTDVTITNVAPVPDSTPQVWVFYEVATAPAHFKIDVSCEGSNARVLVAGPRWRRVTIGTGKMDANVCNPPPGYRLFDWKPPSLPVAAGLVTAGVLLCRFVLCRRD